MAFDTRRERRRDPASKRGAVIYWPRSGTEEERKEGIFCIFPLCKILAFSSQPQERRVFLPTARPLKCSQKRAQERAFPMFCQPNIISSTSGMWIVVYPRRGLEHARLDITSFKTWRILSRTSWHFNYFISLLSLKMAKLTNFQWTESFSSLFMPLSGLRQQASNFALL